MFKLSNFSEQTTYQYVDRTVTLEVMKGDNYFQDMVATADNLDTTPIQLKSSTGEETMLIQVDTSGNVVLLPQLVRQTQLAPNILRMSSDIKNPPGKNTTIAWDFSSHPKATLVKAYAKLCQAPDAATTIDANLLIMGGNDMTNIVSFAAADPVGLIKDFAITDDTLEFVERLDYVTTGTTVTLGVVQVFMDWQAVTSVS